MAARADTMASLRSAEDLALRVPALKRRELTRLAQIGALNQLDGIHHRRDALWQVERAGRPEGPLLRQQSEWLRDDIGDAALAADERRRAPGGRLCRHRAHRGQASHGIIAARSCAARSILSAAGARSRARTANLCARPDASSRGSGPERRRDSSLSPWKTRPASPT